MVHELSYAKGNFCYIVYLQGFHFVDYFFSCLEVTFLTRNINDQFHNSLDH